MKIPTRQPIVEHRRFPLSERDAEEQINKGLFITNGGERFAVPVDTIKDRTTYQHRVLWSKDKDGRIYRPGVRFKPYSTGLHTKVLGFLRDNVNKNIPYLYYLAVLGHDIHVTMRGDLYGRHFHVGWTNPFEPDRLDLPIDPTFDTLKRTHWVNHECDLAICPQTIWPEWEQALTTLNGRKGFIEDLGWLSGKKVTTAFVSEIIDELVSAAGSEFADFDNHEVGTSSAVENNAQTALTATTGIARAIGTPTDADPIYRTVATITADATESWEEEGVFNNTTGPAMMDRSLTGGQSVNPSDQVQYTYENTQNPEA